MYVREVYGIKYTLPDIISTLARCWAGGSVRWQSRRARDGRIYETGMFKDFPRLTEDEIQLAMGLFQLKMAPALVAFHLEHKDDKFKIWILEAGQQSSSKTCIQT